MNELRNAGFDERQARAIVAVQLSAHTTLATKSDLATMKAELAAAIEPLATKEELAHLAEQILEGARTGADD